MDRHMVGLFVFCFIIVAQASESRCYNKTLPLMLGNKNIGQANITFIKDESFIVDIKIISNSSMFDRLRIYYSIHPILKDTGEFRVINFQITPSFSISIRLVLYITFQLENFMAISLKTGHDYAWVFEFPFEKKDGGYFLA
jgi:hypothetical protein